MKTYKLLLFAFALFSATPLISSAQKPIYYLADTTVKSKVKVELGSEGLLKYIAFDAKLFPEGKDKLVFSYHKIPGSTITSKPKHNYLSWDQLSKLVVQTGENHRDFEKKYHLYIVEKLPKNKYHTYKASTVDYFNRLPVQ